MMHRIGVFAGLGSDSLFSEITLDVAVEDAFQPEARILLQECHGIFRDSIAKAIQHGHISMEIICLSDFDEPGSLLRPPTTYHRNVIIQHTTLYLVQILRYLRHFRSSFDLRGVAGFCSGLLPAAVLATSGNVIELLSRARDFFHVALWVGIRSEVYRRTVIGNSSCAASLPWSVVVNGISVEQAQELIKGQDQDKGEIYVSAINSSGCVTLSGRGDQLQQFITEKIPSRCRTRATNVYTLYHNREKLAGLLQQTVEDLRRSIPLLWSSSPVSFRSVLFSTIDGTPIICSTESPATVGKVVEKILEMIFLEPVDWVSIQASILSDLNLAIMSQPEPCEILNFGPGYGMSRPRQILPKNVNIVDVSAAGNRVPSTPVEASGLSLDEIAIVGMAVDLPGARDAELLWENLVDGVNSCSEIPSSRFFVDDFYHKPGQEKRKAKRVMTTRYGNFLHNPFMFDNELFDISPRESRSMDPQQRVMLQTAYRALENSGYVPDSTPSFARDTFGCFIGNATIDYTENLRNDIDVYYSPGTLRAFQSGRISYVFGWSGPSITLDTACSSSMTAFHLAARALAAGDCRAALVGGVNVISSPDMYLGLDRAHFLSPTGQCKVFDVSADGYCRSEGCGAFVIKKVADALAEGDRILAIMKGVEINQSGNAHSITHPHVPTQEKLFNRLFQKTKINPHTITVVEAHGTGTQAGDPNEVESLRRAICTGRDPDNLLHLTSIKANIGHCEAASGAAAIAKVILMMRHGKIPPQISLKTLNPKIKSLGSDGAVIDRTVSAWQSPENRPRLALINNFGAAGSNGALILQEYNTPPIQEHPIPSDTQTYVLGLSAKSAKALLMLRDSLVTKLTTTAAVPSLSDICYTLTARRQIYDYRMSVTVDSLRSAIEKLQKEEPYHFSNHHTRRSEAVFVFSGQGSQYLGMGRALMSIYPTFSKIVYECDQLLSKNGFPGCLDIIMGDKGDDGETNISQMQAFQSAMFVLEVALAKLLISWNILPVAVIGHSLGEYAALVISGVLSLSSGLRLVARRAQLMVQRCQLQATSMLAVNLSAENAQSNIDAHTGFRGLEISCKNSPTDSVVGGPIAQLQTFKEHLEKNHIAKSKMLSVPMAYHTQAMDPILEELAAYARTINLAKPQIPIISNVLGRTIWADEEAFSPEYFASHCRATVSFNEGIEDFLSTVIGSTACQWIEVGPHPSLLPMLSARLDRAKVELFPCLRRDVSSTATISQLLSHFYKNSLGLNWRKAFESGIKPQLVDLPGMPFFQAEFGVSYPHETADRNLDVSDELNERRSMNPFITRRIQEPSDANNHCAIYETAIQSLKVFIQGHIVCGYALCPASVYHEMVLSVAQELESDPLANSIWSLSHISYVAPLLHTDDSTAVIRIVLLPDIDSSAVYTFQVSSYPEGSDPEQGTLHCKGNIKKRNKTGVEQKYSRLRPTFERKKNRFLSSSSTLLQEVFSARAMYNKVFTRVVTYSQMYQKVQSIRITQDNDEAYAICRFSNAKPEQYNPSTANAIFMDVLLHVAGFVANLSVSNEEACICKEVQTASIVRIPGTEGELFDIHCTITACPAEGVIVADAQAVDAKGVMAIFKGMVFQSVKLAKVSQAFQISAKRIQGSTLTAHSIPVRPTKHNLTISGSSPMGAAATQKISTLSEIRQLVAKTCNLNAATLSTDSNLEALGFDSLMMIELESELSSIVPITSSILAECKTVGDIEKLSCVKEILETQAVSDETQSSDEENSIRTPPNQNLTRAIIAETCGATPDALSSNSELQALGIDSLMIFELESRLLEISNGGKLSSELSECRTVGDVEKLVEGGNREVTTRVNSFRSSSPTSTSTTSPKASTLATSYSSTPTTPFLEDERVIPHTSVLNKISRAFNLGQQPEIVQSVNSSESKNTKMSSLYLIHDGSGICIQYHRLRPLQRPVYALHDPKFLDQHDSWPDLGAMADQYATDIIQTVRSPCILGGWSFGGVVAFEVARRLLSRGHPVVGVVLIDSPPPLNHTPLSPRIIDAVTGNGKPPSTATAETIHALTRRSFTGCAAMLKLFRPGNLQNDPWVPRLFLLRSREAWRDLSSPSNGSSSLPEIENAWLQDRSNPWTAVAGWKALTGSEVSVVDIPGNHFQAFDAENITAVSNAISHACLELEAQYAATI